MKKIIKIKKSKDKYICTLSDSNTLSFYDDTILKYNLLKPQSLSNDLLKEIIAYNSEKEAYYIAIKYITAKLRTEKEIVSKLEVYDESTIKKVINKLRSDGYLNDALYIKAYVNDQINLSLKGPKKIAKELVKKGFKEEDVDNLITAFDVELWNLRIDKLINKKIKSNHNLSKAMLIKRIKSYLINEGYQINLINESLNKITIKEDDTILEKAVLKEVNRLGKKYDGEELKLKVKSNLYRKGFQMDKILETINKVVDNL